MDFFFKNPALSLFMTLYVLTLRTRVQIEKSSVKTSESLYNPDAGSVQLNITLIRGSKMTSRQTCNEM